MKKRFLVPMALMVVLTMLLASLPAGADPPILSGNADTVAVISPTGAPPVVIDKWEVSNNPSVIPLSSGPFESNAVFTPSPLSNQNPALDGAQPICVYAVISDTIGIANISGAYMVIDEPQLPATGLRFKLQEPMVQVTNALQMEATKAEAVRSGQISQAQATAYDDAILKQTATMWYACFPYTIHQQPGNWQATVVATNKQGATGTRANPFVIQSLVSLAIDFSLVDYGQVLPGQHKSIAGNNAFATGDGFPTVWNQGNFPAALEIFSTPMTGTTAIAPKHITDFDVMLSSLVPTQQSYLANTWYTILGRLLPCNPTQIDFSILPPAFAGQDTYAGDMYLRINPHPNGFNP